jgi:hypothetical protein
VNTTDYIIIGGVLLFVFAKRGDPGSIVSKMTGSAEKTTGAVSAPGKFDNAPLTPTGTTPPYLPEYGGTTSYPLLAGTDPFLMYPEGRLQGLQNQGNSNSAGYTWLGLGDNI